MSAPPEPFDLAVQAARSLRLLSGPSDTVGRGFVWQGNVAVGGALYAVLTADDASSTLHFAHYGLSDDGIESFVLLGAGKDDDALFARCCAAYMASLDPSLDTDEDIPLPDPGSAEGAP